jgi:hypothetical protein
MRHGHATSVVAHACRGRARAPPPGCGCGRRAGRGSGRVAAARAQQQRGGHRCARCSVDVRAAAGAIDNHEHAMSRGGDLMRLEPEP